MSKEHPQPADPFGFTEHEKRYDRISHSRFQALLADEATTIHKVEVDANNYGEFTFVTLSREGGGQPSVMTMWGLGYHDYRERWITDHWCWYRANQFPSILKQQIALEEAQERLEQRRQEIAPHVSQATQSRRAMLYELLADLTDEDGAYSEMEDLGEAADWLMSGEADPTDHEDDRPTTRPLFGDEIE
jgi:hypothetical protein